MYHGMYVCIRVSWYVCVHAWVMVKLNHDAKIGHKKVIHRLMGRIEKVHRCLLIWPEHAKSRSSLKVTSACARAAVWWLFGRYTCVHTQKQTRSVRNTQEIYVWYARIMILHSFVSAVPRYLSICRRVSSSVNEACKQSETCVPWFVPFPCDEWELSSCKLATSLQKVWLDTRWHESQKRILFTRSGHTWNLQAKKHRHAVP